MPHQSPSKSNNLTHIQTSSCDQTVSLNQAQAKSNQSSNCNKLTHTHNVKTSQTMFNLIHSQPIKNLPESNTVDSQVNLINSKSTTIPPNHTNPRHVLICYLLQQRTQPIKVSSPVSCVHCPVSTVQCPMSSVLYHVP